VTPESILKALWAAGADGKETGCDGRKDWDLPVIASADFRAPVWC
jgi:hypothetical protein